MGRLFRHGGNERDRGGAAADDHDPLVGVVDVLGPLLRVDDWAGEALHALEVRRVALVVAVVAAAEEQEPARHADRFARVAPLRLDGPPRVVARPLRARDAVVEADVFVDPVHGCGLAHVAPDRRPVGDGLRIGPGSEPEAQRVHVRVRPNPRVPEQVPRPADRVPGLEDREALVGALVLQVIAGADPRQTGPDDQHVNVFERHVVQGRTRSQRYGSTKRVPNSRLDRSGSSGSTSAGSIRRPPITWGWRHALSRNMEIVSSFSDRPTS